MLGGRVSVQSEVGKGSVFGIHFPVQLTPLTPSEPATTPNEVRSKSQVQRSSPNSPNSPTHVVVDSGEGRAAFNCNSTRACLLQAALSNDERQVHSKARGRIASRRCTNDKLSCGQNVSFHALKNLRILLVAAPLSCRLLKEELFLLGASCVEAYHTCVALAKLRHALSTPELFDVVVGESQVELAAKCSSVNCSLDGVHFSLHFLEFCCGGLSVRSSDWLIDPPLNSTEKTPISVATTIHKSSCCVTPHGLQSQIHKLCVTVRHSSVNDNDAETLQP